MRQSTGLSIEQETFRKVAEVLFSSLLGLASEGALAHTTSYPVES